MCTNRPVTPETSIGTGHALKPARPGLKTGPASQEDVLRPQPVCGASSVARGGNESTSAGVLLIVHSSNSGIMATVYCINEAELSVNDVRRIFENIDQTRISTKAAYKPKGGEIYVYE